MWCRWCSGCRRARPSARSPHASLRLGVVDLEARPCPPDPPAPSTPAALVSLCVAGRVVLKPGQALPPPTGTAAWPSGALHTGGACVAVTSPARPRRPRAPQPTGSTAWPSRSCGALHTGRANPLRVVVRSRFEVVSCPKCRPPRRKTLKTGCYGRSGLRFGRIGTCHSASLAREPAIASGNPLCRT